MKSEFIFYYTLVDKPCEIYSTYVIDDFIEMIYENSAKIITDDQRKELKLPKDYLEQVKGMISRSKEKIPLYNVFSNRIFLIHWENVYDRVFRENYRFVDSKFYEDLLSLEDPTPENLENIRIISYYDLKQLQKIYYKIFYKSFVVDSYITVCQRPSFKSGLVHISPYYTINEINYLAYEWGIIDKVTIDKANINSLCKKMKDYDISAQTLINHQLYIYESLSMGLVKHYSLFGSYYMNMYLRKTKCCLPTPNISEDIIKNIYLENQILIMIKLIKNAPAFDKDYTVYRFIERDEYLHHLKPNDIYQDSSFMSTTRNPFYYKENYTVETIMIKINLPKNIKGVGLCIESYSNFPKEEEIILQPTTKYRLISVSEYDEHQNFKNFQLKVIKKYVFEWVSNDFISTPDSSIKLNISTAYIPKITNVNMTDLVQHPDIRDEPISHRLLYFRERFTNMNNQFESKIGSRTYTFVFESYDSTSVYKPFFYYETPNGLMITTSNPKYGNINMLLEIGPEIHVNYYFKFSITDSSVVINLNTPDWMQWFSELSFVLGSRTVVIHSNYTLDYNPNDSNERKIMKTRHTFSEDIYLYMTKNIELYKFNEITAKFSYFYLDYLKRYNTIDIIKPYDKNELFRIYQLSKKTNLFDFYLYIVENYPQFISITEEKLNDVYKDPDTNPFNNIKYSLDSWAYLLERNAIQVIPPASDFGTKGSFKQLVGDKKIVKFKNRLRALVGKPL